MCSIVFTNCTYPTLLTQTKKTNIQKGNEYIFLKSGRKLRIRWTKIRKFKTSEYYS